MMQRCGRDMVCECLPVCEITILALELRRQCRVWASFTSCAQLDEGLTRGRVCAKYDKCCEAVEWGL